MTISTDLTEKLARIMALHDCSSYAEAIEHATDKALIQEDEITTQELIQLLAGRLEDVDAVELQ